MESAAPTSTRGEPIGVAPLNPLNPLSPFSLGVDGCDPCGVVIGELLEEDKKFKFSESLRLGLWERGDGNGVGKGDTEEGGSIEPRPRPDFRETKRRRKSDASIPSASVFVDDVLVACMIVATTLERVLVRCGWF